MARPFISEAHLIRLSAAIAAKRQLTYTEVEDAKHVLGQIRQRALAHLGLAAPVKKLPADAMESERMAARAQVIEVRAYLATPEARTALGDDDRMSLALALVDEAVRGFRPDPATRATSTPTSVAQARASRDAKRDAALLEVGVKVDSLAALPEEQADIRARLMSLTAQLDGLLDTCAAALVRVAALETVRDDHDLRIVALESEGHHTSKKGKG